MLEKGLDSFELNFHKTGVKISVNNQNNVSQLSEQIKEFLNKKELTGHNNNEILIIKGGIALTTVKIVELVGESKDSWESAVQNAVNEACKTLDDVTGVYIDHFTADIDNGNIVDYKANVRVAFGVQNRR